MIPVFRPSYGKEELEALKEPFETGWIGLGPKVAEFERKFADYIGVDYAVAVNSCTSALHLAMIVMGVAKREVITTPMTFVATNHAILHARGIPVFADIYPDTLNINPESIAKLVTDRTKAIVAVHYGGHPCDMDAINAIADRHKLAVIEDVAHGCGGDYKGMKMGSLGDIGCFSFNAVKNLATGDGGMITTNDPDVYDRLLKLRWSGISKDTWLRGDHAAGYSWQYNVEELGYKYQMNDITAAIGLVQLDKLDGMNCKRHDLFKRYGRRFAGMRSIETPTLMRYARSSFHNYVIKSADRDKLHIHLKNCGVSTGVHYIPSNRYPMYAHYRGDTPVCDRVWQTLLTLPLFPDLQPHEVDFIADEIIRFNS